MSGRTFVRHPTALGPQMFAFFGGAAAWTAHLVISWLLVPAACDVTAGILMLHAATIVTAVIAVAALGVSWTAWRNLDQNGGQEHPILRERGTWIGLSGVILNVIFVGAILLAGVPNFFIDPCQRAI